LQTRALLEQQNVLSFLVVPIFTKDGFWGFIGFDDRKNERIWTWGEVSVSMTIAGAIGASLDRWQTQAALRESEKKYRELVESANSIIMRRDTAGNITFINKFAGHHRFRSRFRGSGFAKDDRKYRKESRRLCHECK
jgi:PAS domain-containing protein